MLFFIKNIKNDFSPQKFKIIGHTILGGKSFIWEILRCLARVESMTEIKFILINFLVLDFFIAILEMFSFMLIW